MDYSRVVGTRGVWMEEIQQGSHQVVGCCNIHQGSSEAYDEFLIKIQRND